MQAHEGVTEHRRRRREAPPLPPHHRHFPNFREVKVACDNVRIKHFGEPGGKGRKRPCHEESWLQPMADEPLLMAGRPNGAELTPFQVSPLIGGHLRWALPATMLHPGPPENRPTYG